MSARRSHLYGGWPTVALLMAPALLLLGVFVLWPGLRALQVSLSSWTGFSPQAVFVGLENYRILLADERFWQSVTNTLYYFAVGGLAHFTFAYLFAAALTRPQLAGRRLFQTLIVFPAFVSVVGVAILWALLYEPQTGLLNRLLATLGLPGVIWLSPDNAMNAVVACAVWSGVGGHVLILIAGIERIPRDILQAARVDGAGEWRLFTRVTLPMLRHVSYAVVVLWTIGALQIFGLVQALKGPSLPRQIETIATYQYAISFNARDNLYLMGQGAAMAVVLVLLILALVGAVRLAFGRQRLEY